MQLPVQKQIDKILEDINALPEQVQQASIFALNRTAEWMKSQISKEISKEKRLKLKLIRDKIAMIRANKRNLNANLSCNFRSVLVRDLPNVKQTPIGTRAGGKIYPHAFIATLRKGGRAGVYRRKGKERFPVKSVTIPIFDDAVKVIKELLGNEAQQIFEKRFFHEIKRITGAI